MKASYHFLAMIQNHIYFWIDVLANCPILNPNIGNSFLQQVALKPNEKGAHFCTYHLYQLHTQFLAMCYGKSQTDSTAHELCLLNVNKCLKNSQNEPKDFIFLEEHFKSARWHNGQFRNSA